MIRIKPSPTADTRTCDFTQVSKGTLLEATGLHIPKAEREMPVDVDPVAQWLDDGGFFGGGD